jgi:hypothetical protein
MTLSDLLHLPIALSLGIIVVILGAAVIFSLTHKPAGDVAIPPEIKNGTPVEAPEEPGEEPVEPSLPHEERW